MPFGPWNLKRGTYEQGKQLRIYLPEQKLALRRADSRSQNSNYENKIDNPKLIAQDGKIEKAWSSQRSIRPNHSMETPKLIKIAFSKTQR